MNYQAKTKYELIDELLKLQRENESLKISYSKDISECIKLLEEQRVREKYYSTLFDAVDEGFCIVEVIFDENEKPIDYRFLVINPSFEKQAGLTNATGKRMRELAPEHEKYWFEIYGKIAKTGHRSALRIMLSSSTDGMMFTHSVLANRKPYRLPSCLKTLPRVSKLRKLIK